jgi:hypothetical protein
VAHLSATASGERWSGPRLGRKRVRGCGPLRCKRWPAKEMRGDRRTSADGLGPTRKKGFFSFSEFNFQCENISKKS